MMKQMQRRKKTTFFLSYRCFGHVKRETKAKERHWEMGKSLSRQEEKNEDDKFKVLKLNVLKYKISMEIRDKQD